MKLSASIQLIWQLAGAEAVAGEFKEIQPEHFCLGLLKLAELSRPPAAGPEMPEVIAKDLSLEIDTVRQELARRGIDGTRLRRALRRSLGKGGCPFRGGKMHRTQSCRALLEAAAKAAGDAGQETLTAVHLLQGILDAPTPALVQGLDAIAPAVEKARSPVGCERTGAEVAPTAARTARTSRPSRKSLLGKYGEDLIKMPWRSHPEPPPQRTVEARVVLEALESHRAVLLVSSSEQPVMEVLHAAAGRLKLKGRRVMVLSLEVVAGSSEPRQQWERLFAEAAMAKEVILYVPSITAFPNPDKARGQQADWADFLRDAAAQQVVPFICRVSPEICEAHVRRHAIWKRHARVIWLHDAKAKSIPREL